MRSIRTLLTDIIDYAGLFPPAKLDMEMTVRNFRAYIGCEDAWMMGRLIIPVARLDEFETCAGSLLPGDDESPAWRISALTAPAGSDKLDADLERIHIFNEIHRAPETGLAQIDAIELKADSVDDIENGLSLLSENLVASFEVPIGEDPRGLIAALAGSPVTAKVRTGGVTPELFPSTEDLARFIVACVQGGVPFKATAGLHHPIRHFNEGQQVRMHGFLNVFLAATFLGAGVIDPDEVVAMIADESREAFTFTDEQVVWQGKSIGIDKLQKGRERAALSFGSCSFDEPREDLREMGLL